MGASAWPVKVDPSSGCWTWVGKRDKDGSGLIWRGRTPIRAYLIVYETERGPIPPGLVLEHSCKNRGCVGPHHLEPVTQSENLKRKSWRYRSKIPTCPSGHDMTVNSIITIHGGRVCRSCNADANG